MGDEYKNQEFVDRKVETDSYLKELADELDKAHRYSDMVSGEIREGESFRYIKISDELARNISSRLRLL